MLVADITSGVAALIVGFVLAVIVRAIYNAIKNRKIDSDRRVWSWWLVPLTIFFTVTSIAGQAARDQKNNTALTSQAGKATARQRCTTLVVEKAKEAPAEQRALLTGQGDLQTVAANFCAKADRMGALAANGFILKSDAFSISTCADGVMAQFDRIPKKQRAYTRPDFRIFAQRYCEEAVQRNYLEGARFKANQRRLLALQQKVLRDLIRSGKIHQLP